jgi:hypothetical protein
MTSAKRSSPSAGRRSGHRPGSGGRSAAFNLGIRVTPCHMMLASLVNPRAFHAKHASFASRRGVDVRACRYFVSGATKLSATKLRNEKGIAGYLQTVTCPHRIGESSLRSCCQLTERSSGWRSCSGDVRSLPMKNRAGGPTWSPEMYRTSPAHPLEADNSRLPDRLPSC